MKILFLADYGEKRRAEKVTSACKQSLYFFLIRKNMTKFASADMEKTAFFAVVNGVINERRTLVSTKKS